MSEFEQTKTTTEKRPLLDVRHVSLQQYLSHMGMSVYTLFRTPAHAMHHRTLEDRMYGEPQPLHPSIESTTASVSALLAERQTVLAPPHIPSVASKAISAAYMVQFADHFTSDEPMMTIGYDQINELKSRFVTAANAQAGPLTYNDQLALAMDMTGNDVTEALTLLCYASRQYARWLDGKMIDDMPDYTEEEILEQMKEWRLTLLASKLNDGEFQDPAGDTYYAWTHALARVTFGGSQALHDVAAKYIFGRGTDIMHAVVHAVSKQAVPNSHRAAAAYGNAIGDAILEHTTA